MFYSKKLSKYNSISHCFFGRKGGKSKGIYKSLNCGMGSSDNKKNIKQNLRIACQKLSLHYKKIFLLNQIHSNKFYFLKNKPKKKLSGDGLITNKKNLALGILTADCAPVLIVDPQKKIIAAVHAGWRGADSRQRQGLFADRNEYCGRWRQCRDFGG